MKPLPHIITNDDFFFATEAQRIEWNARMAAGIEPTDLSRTVPLNLPRLEPLAILCTWREYDAATIEQQRDYDRRLLECWDQRRQREIGEDIEADHQRGSWGE